MKNITLNKRLSHALPCILYGAASGAVTGGIIFLFKLLASRAESLSRVFYSFAKSDAKIMVVAFIALGILSSAAYFVHKKVPESKGGGIPRSEGILRGVLSFRPLKTLFATVIGSTVSFFSGLGLGSEGPSVLIGTCLGKLSLFGKKKNTVWSRYVMTGGAGAGFAAATGAPLSAILFTLEEIHRRFTPLLVVSVCSAVVSSSCVVELLSDAYGISSSLFDIGALPDFSLSQIGYLLILGVVVAVFVALFDLSSEILNKVSKERMPSALKLLVIFLASGILAMYLDDAVYSGHHVIEHIIHHNHTLIFLVLILILRLSLLLLTVNAGATGGIFIPSLAIGALISAITAEVLVYVGLPAELYDSVVLLGMAAFIGGVMRSPIMATVLFIELTGQFSSLLFVVTVVFVTYLITELFNKTGFYDSVIEKMQSSQNKGKSQQVKSFRLKVSPHSFAVNQTVRDVMWPSSAVVVSIQREGHELQNMDSVGDAEMLEGDIVNLRVKFFDEEEITKELSALVGEIV